MTETFQSTGSKACEASTSSIRAALSRETRPKSKRNFETSKLSAEGGMNY